MRSLWVKYVSRFILQIGAVALLLVAGVGTKMFLASMRKPPAQATEVKRPVPVEVIKVQPEDVPVLLDGLGVARSLNVVNIAAEVAGRIIEIHPRLEVGEVIPAGETLFKIDPRDYEAALAQAEAQVAILESNVAQIRIQYETDKKRLKTLRRTRDLAKTEFERIRTLLAQDRVGSQSGVDQAEMAFNQANDVCDLLEQQVRLHPIRIQEAESSVASAKAQRDRAKTNLERCVVASPFDARLQMVNLEANQFAQPGVPQLTLADDSLLEIIVPLQSTWVREWLQFEGTSAPGDQAWFPAVEPVVCRVRWTESPQEHYWTGTLHRVERFDRESVTAKVAVRVSGAEASSGPGGLPLVDGMFCSVEIPGKVLDDVFRLPPWTVNTDGEVYVANGNELERRPVSVVREQGGFSFVSEGLKPGDQVITTRLVNPMAGTPLEIQAPAGKESES